MYGTLYVQYVRYVRKIEMQGQSWVDERVCYDTEDSRLKHLGILLGALRNLCPVLLLLALLLPAGTTE